MKINKIRNIIFFFLFLAVPYVFGLSMTVDSNGTVFLGDIKPGQSEFDAGFNYANDSNVSVNVNPALPWALDISSSGFMGPANLPIENLLWQVSYKEDLPNGNDPLFPSFPNDVRKAFASGVSDPVIYSGRGGNGGVAGETGVHRIHFLFHIGIPRNQQAGTYMANVIFTLTQ